MKKAILCLLYSLCYTLALAQSGDAVEKGEAARARMLQAFGGEQAVGQVRHFSYTLVRATTSGDTSRTVHTLDLKKRYIRTSTQTAAGTEVRSIDATGAWKSISGQREPLSVQEAEALQRTFFFNFIPMLQNERLQYTFLRSDTYQNRPVDIVRVQDPANQALVLDLFLDRENGQVLTSSRLDTAGQYPYFADELEYKPVGGHGVIFPLMYQMVVDGQITTVGRFEAVQLSR